MLRRFVGLAAVAGAAYAGYRLVVEPWWTTWGVDPGEAARPLPGDDVIPDGVTAQTRGITIDVPPAAVWPWLVQMGFGRAGWYSYDQVDMNHPSATTILPDHGTLQVGDVVPTHPGGGFVVKSVEPDHHLVLFMDTELAREQARSAAEADPTPANLRMAGAFMEGAQPTEFAASWAFVLEPVDGGRTRLIERVRVAFGTSDKPWTRFTMPIMGFGVFLMMRKQMLGIRDRAEGAGAPQPVATEA
jgi:hypothetical protein